MKKIKFNKKKFSGLTLLKEDADKIRKLASNRGINVYDMSHSILEEWSSWKEPEMAENPIDITQEV
jgi:hypothetical protein